VSQKLDAALALARRGFRVFPLRPYGKKPAVGAFQFVATTDEDTIRAWWNIQPEYNPGVLTTDMVVVDVDVKHGEDAINVYTSNGGHFETLVVETATKGLHCYFDGPDSKLAVRVFPGIDIRSHNGYVVGPGSYVDPAVSGELDIKRAGWYRIVHDNPIRWVPHEIEARLEAPGKRERVDIGVEYDTPTAIANANVWLQDAEPAIEGLGGDSRTYETAVRLVRDYALTEETAFQLLAETWNERCLPPWPLDALWRKVENAAAYGQGDLGTARPEAHFGSVQLIPTPLATPAHQRGVYMGNLLDAANIKSRPWLVSRLLLRGDVTVIAGAGAGGKSILMLAMFAHWAVGKDFGPYKLAVPGKALRCMFYNAEDDKEEQSRRVLAICHIFGLDYTEVKKNLCSIDDADGELLLATAPQGNPASNIPAIEYIINAIRHEQVDVFGADPLVNLHTCKESDNGHMRFVMGLFRRIARETQSAVFIAHHTSKGGDREERGDADAIRGAGAIVNSGRIAIMVSNMTKEDRQEYGIDAEDKYAYVRIDDAKANMFQRAGKAILYAKWQSIKLTTGDVLGVPVPANMADKTATQTRHIAGILAHALVARNAGSFNLADAVKTLKAADELYFRMPDTTIRAHVTRFLKNPVLVEDMNLRVMCEHDGASVLIKIV
jgi:hypothetical protein